MKKIILLTGATDGIGLETAKLLYAEGHHLLLHGRNPAKLSALQQAFSEPERAEIYQADLSHLSEVEAMAEAILQKHSQLDVLINNAGVFRAPQNLADNGLDIRFMVNTLAPYRLTQRLLPIMNAKGRVVNLSSAAQSPVNLEAMEGKIQLGDMPAYAQSKLAITMWSRAMGLEHQQNGGPMVVSVNPGSLLASKMVRDAFGVAGKDIMIGANILRDAALSPNFEDAYGKYYDNDAGRFGPPHHDALNPRKTATVVKQIESILEHLT